MTTLLAARSVSKTYRLGRVDVPVLRGVSVTVAPGEWVAILGASGSGKSTLLHLLGGLDRPDRPERPAKANGRGERHEALDDGQILFEGRSLQHMSQAELDRYRNVSVGFVFQFYHLLPELNVVENAALGAMIRHGRLGYMRRATECRDRARSLLELFGLGQRLRHRPAELSGGERQRVAIARALMNEPAVLLADEPTGNLDRATGAAIIDVIASFRETSKQTIVMVTHDIAVAERADRVLELRDGRVVEAK
ncbi:MAG: ABC transporter ATP-binding protein [Phycisphaeraceae bacterium]|nr:MAG: ABC transporter ATP-binding protein [Phycisphaeraceae bacterium]